MSVPTPVPAPRLNPPEPKKPVPTPRRTLLSQQKSNESSSSSSKSSDEHTNSFSRRVRSLSNASKQIAGATIRGHTAPGDIGDLVHDKKKAVIEGTRQSVRRITKRFNSYNHDEQSCETPEPSDVDLDDTVNIFNSISFQSPINRTQSIYNNVGDDYSSSSDDFISSPPPSHPPPPLPDDSVYDAPLSIASGSTSTSDLSSPPSFPPQFTFKPSESEIYETVYPSYCNSSSDSDSKDLSSTETAELSSQDLSRCGSWKFYDPVTKIENIYNNIDETPEVNPVISPTIADTNHQHADNNDNVVDTNSNFSRQSSVEVRNSVYENHQIVAKAQERKRPSESVMLLFDPLRNQANEDEPARRPAATSDILQLEELLQGDLFADISALDTLDDWSVSNESEPDDFINPPPPPVRVDSLPDEEQDQPSPSPREKRKTNWFSAVEVAKQNISEARKSNWLRQVKGALPDFIKGSSNKDDVVQRPELEAKSFVHNKGMLYKVQGGPVEDIFGEYSGRWCVLQNSELMCYSDNTCDTLKEYFPADTILSIQILQDPKFKYKYDNDDLHCFELNTTGKSRGGHIYGTRDISERRVWMQCIAESLTKKFSTKITTDYTRMGWAYLREGVSGKWMGAWIVLSHRTLYYGIDRQPMKSVDLRKVRCIVLQVHQDSDNNPRTNDRGPNMVVDSPNITLYLRMWTTKETKVWCHIVKLAAHNNGANLDQQQLTKNNIPVLVEKCINFIYAHGSMAEGIYRRPGIGSAVSEILTKFRKDAWAVQLIHDKYTEHDVATALKRFFRDLPEPLLSTNQRKYFYQVSLLLIEDEKIRMYKAGLDQLPHISYKTAKKLLGHLHFISSQSTKNLMTADNLASLWGPTLMHYEEKESLANSGHQQDMAVVKQLIDMYRSIFPEDPGEVEQERLMLQVLERYTKSPQGAVSNKKAGDLRVWVYLHDRDGQTFNIAIGPNKTAYDVCVELSGKVNIPVQSLILEEVVLNDKLSRPIHHSEKVLDVVLRWSYWDDPDRKDNVLILTRLTKYLDFIQNKLLPVVSGELKYADAKTRNFKVFMFEFSQAKLTCFKDRSCEAKLFMWNIEDVVWYLGHEKKRHPQSIWTVTFLETRSHPKRTKGSPYFGHILAWADPTTRASWLAAMLRARYPNSLKPPAMHVNLMEN